MSNPNLNPFIDATDADLVPFEGAPVPPPMSVLPGGVDGMDEAFSIDLEGVTDGYTVPEGTYKVQCADIEQRVSQGGNPMFVWTFKVAEGAYAGFELMHFTAITPAAMWKVSEVVRALGIGEPGQKCSFTRKDVIGKTCTAEIKDDDYNDRVRSKIDKLYA